jgi:hypothetical protein
VESAVKRYADQNNRRVYVVTGTGKNEKDSFKSFLNISLPCRPE